MQEYVIHILYVYIIWFDEGYESIDFLWHFKKYKAPLVDESEDEGSYSNEEDEVIVTIQRGKSENEDEDGSLEENQYDAPSENGEAGRGTAAGLIISRWLVISLNMSFATCNFPCLQKVFFKSPDSSNTLGLRI